MGIAQDEVFRTIGARQTARILGARGAPRSPTQKEAFSWCPLVDPVP